MRQKCVHQSGYTPETREGRPGTDAIWALVSNSGMQWLQRKATTCEPETSAWRTSLAVTANLWDAQSGGTWKAMQHVPARWTDRNCMEPPTESDWMELTETLTGLLEGGRLGSSDGRF